VIPARYVNLDAARARFGDRVDRLAPFLLRGDPLADDLVETMESMPAGRGWALFNEELARSRSCKGEMPEAMRAFFAQVDRVPLWVDWTAIERGGELLMRSGAIGGIVLGAASLVMGYGSPAGNKPLIFSGRLINRATRRLNETARFVQATGRPGGLRRNADGFAITVKVRLMHAKVRRLLRRTEDFRQDLWGDPINQHDMAATTLLFSLIFLEGLRSFGIEMTRDESESFMHLWRYSGYLSGVDEEILPTSEFDGWNLGELIKATQGPPDDDSRTLVKALFDSTVREAKTPEERRMGEVRRRMGHGFCRGLLGEEMADALGVPRTPFVVAFHALHAVVKVAEQARARSSEAHRVAVTTGSRYWDKVIEMGLAGVPAEFTPPERLVSAA
jgi:hypothetical protein